MTRHWTDQEVQAFKTWNEKRSSGGLGKPMRFNNVDSLMNWLHAK